VQARWAPTPKDPGGAIRLASRQTWPP
jgi:hypothetical protein